MTVKKVQCATEENYLGTCTATSAAFLTMSPRMTSTSIGRLASRSTNIDGLKSLGFVRRMMLMASSCSMVPAWIPLVRATRIISPMISFTLAITSSTFGSARSSLTLARETVHKVEYAAFLSSLQRQRSDLSSNLGTCHKTFFQRWSTISDSGVGLVPPFKKRSVKSIRDSSPGFPSGQG